MAIYVNKGERTGGMTIVKSRGRIDQEGMFHPEKGVKVYPVLAWLPGPDALREPAGPEVVDTDNPSAALQIEAQAYWGDDWEKKWVKEWEKVAKRHNYEIVDKHPLRTRVVPVRMTVEQYEQWRAQNQPEGPAMDQEVAPKPKPNTEDRPMPVADENVVGKPQRVQVGGRGVSNKGK